ncbi:hypothetical protein Tco_1335057 [Tanacetum coccineum]
MRSAGWGVGAMKVSWGRQGYRKWNGSVAVLSAAAGYGREGELLEPGMLEGGGSSGGCKLDLWLRVGMVRFLGGAGLKYGRDVEIDGFTEHGVIDLKGRGGLRERSGKTSACFSSDITLMSGFWGRQVEPSRQRGGERGEGDTVGVETGRYSWVAAHPVLEDGWREGGPRASSESLLMTPEVGVRLGEFMRNEDGIRGKRLSGSGGIKIWRSIRGEEFAEETIDKEWRNQTTTSPPPERTFVSNDNEGRMVEKCIVEIQGTFLVKVRNDSFNGNDGEKAYDHINKFLEIVGPIKINGLTHDQFRLSIFPVSLAGAAYEWFTKECIGSITTWDNMLENFILKFHHLSDHNEEEPEEDDNPNETDNVPEILRIKGNLFDFETPLCEAYNEFSCLLKIDTDLFTYDIQNFKTYDEYKQELNDDKAKDTREIVVKNGYMNPQYVLLTKTR